ncbi:hypothetical protein GCM10027404_33290 [Arthrobacter tumbae]|uniref:hypothetical protein n=1 Tax=Arthrobacter tumbae TaxID=163874 RepID=UPI00195C2910|nr:hypothetical protein [Arthrobacter tumbae]MBM7781921.1 hypothetical protein [Arthrobacter tumbae]
MPKIAPCHPVVFDLDLYTYAAATLVVTLRAEVEPDSAREKRPGKLSFQTTDLFPAHAGRESLSAKAARFSLFHVLTLENQLTQEHAIDQEVETSSGIWAKVELVHFNSQGFLVSSILAPET